MAKGEKIGIPAVLAGAAMVASVVSALQYSGPPLLLGGGSIIDRAGRTNGSQRGWGARLESIISREKRGGPVEPRSSSAATRLKKNNSRQKPEPPISGEGMSTPLPWAPQVLTQHRVHRVPEDYDRQSGPSLQEHGCVGAIYSLAAMPNSRATT